MGATLPRVAGRGHEGQGRHFLRVWAHNPGRNELSQEIAASHAEPSLEKARALNYCLRSRSKKSRVVFCREPTDPDRKLSRRRGRPQPAPDLANLFDNFDQPTGRCSAVLP